MKLTRLCSLRSSRSLSLSFSLSLSLFLSLSLSLSLSRSLSLSLSLSQLAGYVLAHFCTVLDGCGLGCWLLAVSCWLVVALIYLAVGCWLLRSYFCCPVVGCEFDCYMDSYLLLFCLYFSAYLTWLCIRVVGWLVVSCWFGFSAFDNRKKRLVRTTLPSLLSAQFLPLFL